MENFSADYTTFSVKPFCNNLNIKYIKRLLKIQVSLQGLALL